MSEINAAGTVETPTVEELQNKLDAETQARAKAEAKIVDMKKSTTTQPSVEDVEPVKEDAPTTFDEDAFEKKYAEKKFFEANPEMSEHTEALNEYINKGISYEDAKTLVLKADPTISNRQNTQNANISNGDVGSGAQQYTQEDLYNLGQKDPALKRKAMEDIAAGKATETV